MGEQTELTDKWIDRQKDGWINRQYDYYLAHTCLTIHIQTKTVII